MKTQELLTYVEELVFKTSMFGYDKDEVDIQLDKICDEVEAIVKEKDKEIEALKKGQPYIAPEPAENAGEENADLEALLEEGGSEEAVLKEQTAMLKKRLQEAEARAAAAEKQAQEAEERAAIAEKKAAAAEGKAAVAETKAAAQASAQTASPVNKDEAYEHYMRNADLLCKQLSDLEGKQEGIIKEAEEKAAKIIEEAQVQANEVLAGIQNKRAEEQKKCGELQEQKEKMISSLTHMTEEVKNLIEKVQRA